MVTTWSQTRLQLLSNCEILCQPYLWDTPHDDLSHTHRLDYLPTVSHRSSIELPTRWLNTMGLKKVKQYLNSPFLIIRPFRCASRRRLAIKVGENVQFMKYHVCAVRQFFSISVDTRI